ncbi:B RRP1-like protein [Triplophysa tibetana]|uniref:B RRP1-like protein n=1 Tax=Triplophysa tibetana TaxID=1572043 RepID=A0A5A9P3G5_9TELE|nr:B RRP1-like protein [Triplophysa tibetana]
MASQQEAEIIFAQKLASNEKPIRSKAILKLRKYISMRSERELLYFKTFLQTMKREWNGIDRLRMDKFFQMVRFVFREMFKLLRQQDWKSSLVNEFLELISEQLLQSSSSAPPGLILHILDLYMTELAAVGSDMVHNTSPSVVCELYEDTEVMETFVLLISDQEEDSGLVEDDLSDVKGVKGHDECGPVLQFDYGAVADRLFQLASLTYISSFNRSKIYKFVKTFRDLAEGVFPQDEMEQVSTDDEDDDDDRRKKRKRKRSKKQSQEKTDKEGENSSETTPEVPSQEPKQERKRKKKSVKSVEDETLSDADRPAADLRPDEKESESGADVETNISVLPPALQKKKKKKIRKLKKTMTRNVHDDEQTDDGKLDENQTSHITSAPEHASREEEPSSDPSPITKPLKKRKVKKMKTRDAHDEKEENYSGESNVTSARDEEPSSDPSTPKKRKTKQTSSDKTENNMTARKSERKKPDKQTNGFVFREKKSPTALFCRSPRMSRRRQSCTTPKSETKKVTFGLKNNQTMEFRKMDRSALVSPGGPSRVAFDPKKTPVSGVLKSPTSSPALRRRFTAADFF